MCRALGRVSNTFSILQIPTKNIKAFSRNNQKFSELFFFFSPESSENLSFARLTSLKPAV